MVSFNENGNPPTYGKSQNFKSRPAFNRGKKPQFNEGSKQNFTENNKLFRGGNNAPYNKGNNKAVDWQNNDERRQIEEQVNDCSSNSKNQQNRFVRENITTNTGTTHDPSESSDSEDDIMIQNNDIVGDSETSESENESVLNIKKEVGTNKSEEDKPMSNNKIGKFEIIESDDDEPEPINKTEVVEISDSDDDDEPESVIKTEVVEISESEEIELLANDKMETSDNEDESQTEDDTEGAKEFQRIRKNEEAGVKVIEYQNSNINSERDKRNLLGTVADSTITREMTDREILVRNIPSVVEEEHLEKFFSKFGKIHTLKMTSWWNSEKFGKTSKVCSIVFENVEDAHKALEVNGMEYQQHYLEVCLSANKCRNEPDKEIFVGSLPHDASINDVWRAFEVCGIIKGVFMECQNHYGFVHFESPDHVELALAMDIYINGQKVDVQRSCPRNIGTLMESQQSLTVHAQPRANIQIHKNALDNSVTITFRSKDFSRPQFHQETQEHKVRSGFIRKKR